ncbi:integrase [Cellvibrio zantedeschiae]|uniref:Integrase n=1 Tax=Cellvibrio zantedeschiae TaxID=1237077 RepID=A0ABQ3ANC4_9GAMM|nr:integrase family protein [Cellvibrio zantedeschiae]GGY61461.1 integrase [Cellvibrio zantedeschiae]
MSEKSKLRFTKELLLALPIAAKRERYRDSKVEGLVLDILTTGKKVFRVYKRVRGTPAPISVTIGRFPEVTIEQARTHALKILGAISLGVNPNELERINRRSNITLLQVYEDYKSRKELKSETIRGYEQVMRTYVSDWHALPIITITESLIKLRHKELSASSKAQADLCMRLLRALFNFALYEYKNANDESIFTKNPTHVLSHQKLWNNVGRKQTRIYQNDIKGWYGAISRVRNTSDAFTQAVCDFVEMTFFTGLRKTELLCLPWADVDLKARVFCVAKTKNGVPLLLPIGDHLLTIFERRRKQTDGAFVFQANNEHGYVREPKKIIAKLVEESGIPFTLHDLRRTYTSTAELLKIGTYTIKRLLNHKTKRDDVTAGYTILTAEELRSPVQVIETRLLELAGIKSDQHINRDRLLSIIDTLSDADKSLLISKLSDSKFTLVALDGARGEAD